MIEKNNLAAIFHLQIKCAYCPYNCWFMSCLLTDCKQFIPRAIVYKQLDWVHEPIKSHPNANHGWFLIRPALYLLCNLFPGNYRRMIFYHWHNWKNRLMSLTNPSIREEELNLQKSSIFCGSLVKPRVIKHKHRSFETLCPPFLRNASCKIKSGAVFCYKS